MTHFLALVQSKGGVAKTTTALNLAAALVRVGYSVRVFDADVSRSAALVAGDGRLDFDVIDHPLESADAKGIAKWTTALRAEKPDFVLIDAPGAMGAAFGASLAIAHLALVPSGASLLDLRGAAETIALIRRHRKATGTARPDILVVPSRIDRRTASGRDAVATLASLTEAVAPPVSYRAVVADAFAMGETVPPSSESAHEFDALAAAVLTRLGVDL